MYIRIIWINKAPIWQVTDLNFVPTLKIFSLLKKTGGGGGGGGGHKCNSHLNGCGINTSYNARWQYIFHLKLPICGAWPIKMQLTKYKFHISTFDWREFEFIIVFVLSHRGPRWRSGNTLSSHLWGWRFKPRALCRKVGSYLLMVSSLQCRTLTN